MGSSPRWAGSCLPWGRWGSGIYVPNEYGVAHRRGTRGGLACRGVAETVAVVALGISIGVDGFFDLEPF